MSGPTTFGPTKADFDLQLQVNAIFDLQRKVNAMTDSKPQMSDKNAVEILAEMNRHIEALEAMGTKAFFSLETARKDRAEFLSALRAAGDAQPKAAPQGQQVADAPQVVAAKDPAGAAPDVAGVQERKQGYSALLVRSGKIEQFDPHPAPDVAGGMPEEPFYPTDSADVIIYNGEKYGDLMDAINDYAKDLRAHAERLAGELKQAERREREGWIPVSERLPDGEDVLVAWDSGGVEQMQGESVEAYTHRLTPTGGIITHWMPLPAAPKGELWR